MGGRCASVNWWRGTRPACGCGGGGGAAAAIAAGATGGLPLLLPLLTDVDAVTACDGVADEGAVVVVAGVGEDAVGSARG